MNLTARQACAIESAALHNPNFDVFVLFSCPTLRPLSIAQKSLINVIESIPNVHFRQLNLQKYATDTPVEDWIKKGYMLKGRYPMEHTSDLLRLISLYRYGGIYIDLDVVVLRSLEDVPLNYVGAFDNVTLGNGVLSVEPTGTGHEIAELFLRDFKSNYTGEEYTRNGPQGIRRVVRAICGVEIVKAIEEGRKICRGFQVFNSTAFYALPYQQWRHSTDPEFLEDTMEKTKDSYLIHLWNNLSHKKLFKVGSNTAYGKYAEIHCPKSYAAAGEYF
ncbi:lactosylceramide 4-alpha-galactosyltransferase [Drosophila grimshawi]|uniref:GH10342 n=1 Tax=Drosophila grimshawi TaxID=7222 RepID=B4JA58_DROGR|nr:lactosylceramide 4-alpha-galactosyltransferase [Drosophila grimshawi]EDW03732.1 GH10342 [Drosophila grimshawi]